ncbi:MAG: TAXI family TRAP transporter solute-binding subunit [Pseudobdellovibrio sp.]
MTQSTQAADTNVRFGLRTIMELFDIGPAVAYTVIAVIVFVLALGIVFFIRSAPPSQITITSGPEGSMFNKIAIRYAKVLEKNGVKVNVLTSNGSLQNFERISDPKSKVDLAIIQGGLISDDAKLDNVVSLGGISNQPIFFFYRGKPMERLADFKGKRIAIGPEGSGTRQMALKLLQLNDINEKNPGTTKLLNIDADGIDDALLQNKIDGGFVMSENTSSEDLKKLLHSPAYRLLSFKNANAYVRKLDYLNILELPEGIIDFGLNIPATDVTLVGPTVELIATKNLHPALSDLILDAATSLHSHPGTYQKRGEFPAPIEREIKVSSDAMRFYKSGKSFLYNYLPFWLASLVNRILVVFLPILLVLIPAVRSIPAMFRYSTQLRIRRRYRELLAIEEKYKSEKDPSRIKDLHKNLDRIDKEIRQMKVKAAFADQFYSLRGHADYVRRLMETTVG